MNVVRISGRLENIEGTFDINNNPFIRAMLRFGDSCVPVIAVSENIFWLERFTNGDHIKLEARLVTRNGSLVLLVDSCEEYTVTKPRAEIAQEGRELCNVRHMGPYRRSRGVS